MTMLVMQCYLKYTIYFPMKINFIKNIGLSFVALLIIFSPIKKLNAISPMSHNWIEVPKSQFGNQFWDKDNIQKNQDGSIRVFSKFLPKSMSKISQDILYTMDINCSNKTFRDVAIGTNEFNEFKSNNADWKDPNADQLILSVINQVCTFEKNSKVGTLIKENYE